MDSARLTRDLDYALKQFASTKEQLDNWEGFAVYCMTLACSFHNCYKKKFPANEIMGWDPSRTHELSQIQIQLTSNNIDEIKNGTTINADVQKLFDSFKGKSEVEKNQELKTRNAELNLENRKLKAIILAKVNSTNEKIKNELQRDMRTVLAELELIKKKTEDIERKNAVETEEKKIVEYLTKLESALSSSSLPSEITDLIEKLKNFLKREQTAEHQKELSEKNEKIKQLESEVTRLNEENQTLKEQLTTYVDKGSSVASDQDKSFCETLCNYFYNSLENLIKDSTSAQTLNELWTVMEKSIYKKNTGPQKNFPAQILTSIFFVKLCEKFESKPYDLGNMQLYFDKLVKINSAQGQKKRDLFIFLIYGKKIGFHALISEFNQEIVNTLQNHEEHIKNLMIQKGCKYNFVLKSIDKSDLANEIVIGSVQTNNVQQSILYNRFEKGALSNFFLEGLALVCISILSIEKQYPILLSCIKSIFETYTKKTISNDTTNSILSYLEILMPEKNSKYENIKFAHKIYLQSVCLTVANADIQLYKSTKKNTVFSQIFKEQIVREADLNPTNDITVEMPDI